MKKFNLLTLALLLLTTPSLVAQNREVRNVGTFTKISFAFSGKLYLKQGSPQKVELEGDSELLEEIETEVTGGRLTIGKDDKLFNWRSTGEKLTVYITVPNIEAVSVSGSGNIIGQSRIRTNDLDLKVSGSGSMSLDVEANGEVDADVSGSGDMDLKGHFESFESDVSGSGRVSVSAIIENTADFAISGSGKIQASGSADNVKANISGSGKVMAADMETDRCNVRITGSGDVEINVKNELETNITGSGTVSYRGNPRKLINNAAGSGTVRKM